MPMEGWLVCGEDELVSDRCQLRPLGAIYTDEKNIVPFARVAVVAVDHRCPD